MICEKCNTNAHTCRVTFHQNIAVIVLTFKKTYTGNFCRKCINNLFLSTSTVNLLLGWWSLKTLFLTPVYLFLNVVEYFRARKTPLITNQDRESFKRNNLKLMLPYLEDIKRSLKNGNSVDRVATELSAKACVPIGDAHTFVVHCQSTM